MTSLLEEYRKMNDVQKTDLDKLDWWRYLVNNGCEGRDLDIRELLDSTDFGESLRHISAYTALAAFAESSEKNEIDLKIKGIKSADSDEHPNDKSNLLSPQEGKREGSSFFNDKKSEDSSFAKDKTEKEDQDKDKDKEKT